MYRLDYRFGGVRFALTAESNIRSDPQLDQFRVPEAEAGYRIRCRFVEQLPPPPEHTPLDTPTEKAWKTDGVPQGYQAYQLTLSDPLRPACRWSRVGMVTDMLWTQEFRTMLYARNILMSADLLGCLLEQGGLVLHASYILYRGQAILFSGPSGMGKSTQAGLWQAHRGADIINGDRALIRRGADGTFWAHGICYSGTSGICKNVSAPLNALVLLSQGSESHTTQLRGITAFRALLPRISYHTWDPQAGKYATDILSALLSEKPAFHLCCRPDESAVQSLENYL